MRPASFTGLAFNDGIGLGHVVLHEPRIVVTNLFNEDSDDEIRRLESSINSLRLYRTDKEGNRVYLNDAELSQRRIDAAKAVEAICGPQG